MQENIVHMETIHLKKSKSESEIQIVFVANAFVTGIKLSILKLPDYNCSSCI